MEIHIPTWNRRRFLQTLGQSALLTALPPSLRAAAGGDTTTVSIFHTTDLHGHILPTTDYAGRPDLGGLARCATQIRAWRKENPASVLLDLGDVYQGTAVSLNTGGSLMIRALDALGYDGWVVGNHEFDWGPGPFSAARKDSTMPVLSGNLRCPASASSPALRPYLLKEVAGFRLALIGLTTPALSTWLPPEDLDGVEALDPLESLATILREVAALHPDAIILAGHMGLIRRDDEANPVGALTRQFPQLAVCLGGHTHEDHPGEFVNGVLYTQADHYGIHAGRVDLTFDPASRRLLGRQATTVLMDHSVALDPAVISLCHEELGKADQLLAQPAGELTEVFRAHAMTEGRAGDQERLIGSAMLAALRARGIEAGLVAHGLFTEKDLAAGPLTLGAIWTLLPYENEIVTIDLLPPELLVVANELLNARKPLSLMGVAAVVQREGRLLKVSRLLTASGAPLPDRPMYRVALNSYDAQSGGGRYPILAQLAANPARHRLLHRIRVRDALVGFMTEHGKVGRAQLLV